MRHNLKKFRRGLLSLGMAGAMTLGVSTIAYAKPAASPQIRIQFGDRDRDRRLTREQLSDFNRFLDDHPRLGRDLRDDPTLVNDRDYTDDHPVLRDWLNNHDFARRALRNEPGAFMDIDRYMSHDYVPPR